MKPETYYLSCSIPLANPDLQGTEKDGSKSDVYGSIVTGMGHLLSPISP